MTSENNYYYTSYLQHCNRSRRIPKEQRNLFIIEQKKKNKQIAQSCRRYCRVGKLLWQVLGTFVWKHRQSEMFEIEILLKKLAAKQYAKYRLFSRHICHICG